MIRERTSTPKKRWKNLRRTIVLWLGVFSASAPAQDKILFLTDEREVLKTRYELLANERTEIFSIYYLWDGNRVGAGALAAHREAAKNGAKVRIIIDGLSALQTKNVPRWLRKKIEAIAPLDNITTSMMKALLEDGVEIRIFNPLRLQQIQSLGFPRINTRTHDKIGFYKGQKVVDLGDRNWQALNFRLTKGGGKTESYRSAETFFTGDQVEKVEKYLNALWDKEDWVTKPDLSKVEASDVLADRRYLETLTEFTRDKLGVPKSTIHARMLPVESLEFMHDVPGMKRRAPGMEKRLLEVIGEARKKITIVSPYVVLTPKFKKLLLQKRKNGVEIEIITPSARTTDAPLASAAFDAQAKELLASGIKIYHHQGPDFLHAKMLLLDEDRTIVTTHNLDAISEFLNYESGVLVKSRAYWEQASAFVKQIKESESLEFTKQRASRFLRCLGLLMKFVTEHPPLRVGGQ